MRYLLTNDDGIEAPGLAALARAIAPLGDHSILAPAVGHSGCGHQVTSHRPLSVFRRDADRCSTDGTPADCVRLALSCIYPDVDCVLSGINAGGNLGADSFVSGTIAAAREAAFLGKPAIAISHYRRRGVEIDWPLVEPWVTKIVSVLTQRSWVRGTFFNVNLPHLMPGSMMPEIDECFTDTNPLPVSFREEADCFHYCGDYHSRLRSPGSDIDVCLSGKIAVTVMRLG